MTIRIDDWDAQHRLPHVLDDVGDQLDDTLAYAAAWAARPDGFATSPVCVLRPLAVAMEVLAEGFAVLARHHRDDWADLRDGVVVASELISDSDVAAVVRLPEARTPQPPFLPEAA